MSPIINVAVRDWDHLVPLVLGDVKSSAFDLLVTRVPALVKNVTATQQFHAAEMSFSQYVRLRDAGDYSIFGIPHFIMRGFRHRCIVTAKENALTTIEDLFGKRIGMTGWADSGNTWTRAILRRSGIEIGDAHWFVGRLTNGHEITDRLDGFGTPGRIEAIDDEGSLVDFLLSGKLDAIFTPFMPPGFFEQSSGLRQLLPECRSAELDYFRDVGFVPGIHILAVKPTVVRDNPSLPTELSDILDASSRLWLQKREKFADTTPWLIEEFLSVSRGLPPEWNSNGLEPNKQMIESFAHELFLQGVVSRLMSAEEIFPPINRYFQN